MRNIIGILLFILFLNPALSIAQDVQPVLKDNLKIKLSQDNEKVIPVKKVVEKEEISAPVNTNTRPLVTKTEPVNTIKELPADYSNVKRLEPQYKKTLVQNKPEKKISMSEKKLNMILIPKVQTRPDGIIYKETQRNVNVINPQKNVNANNNYPGLRGPNELIVYTSVYGLRTGTNEFGTEAIVENNMVVRLNGADSIIPKNGFVISGHGQAKNWIIQNIQVGSKVYIDYSNNTIKVFLTPESLLFAAKQKIKEVNGLIEYYRHLDILYNDKKASDYLNTSKDYLRKAERKPEKTQNYINEAMTSLDNAIQNAIPYFENELKGVWLRPVEKNQNDIEKTLDRLRQIGITDIFLETYFHGKTIYPSEYMKSCGVIYQREEFKGFDPLEIWIKEAHKRKMKVHVWFETFYVGNDNPQKTPNHVLGVYPSWANKRLFNYDSALPVPSLSEHNGYFLDPSNPQVQTYLISILTEIVNKYHPDGINLDYIRYPQTVEPSYSNYASMNWGYTQNARADFKSQYGIDPINIKYGTPEWDNWALYRQNQVTKFIVAARKVTQNSNITLTAVMFPDLKKSTATKMQNWQVWSVNNYVDGLTPLLLTGDKNTADLLIQDVIKNTSSSTKIYPGLFVTFMGGSKDDLLLQIHKTREYKAKGSIIFDYAHLNDKYVEALTTRVYNVDYEPRDSKIKPAPVQTVVNTETSNKETKKKKKRRKNKDDDN